LQWLNLEAEESLAQVDVLSSDIADISQQQATCDRLHSAAKVTYVNGWVIKR